MREPGIYWTWDRSTRTAGEHIVDYASRDAHDRIDVACGVNVTDRKWRRVHFCGLVLVLSWAREKAE